MEITSLLNIIEDAYFEKWLDEIEKKDDGNHLKTMLSSEKLLTEKITDEDNEIFEKYHYAASCYFEIRLYKMCEKVLSEGIKIGMDVQKILSED